MVDFHNPAVIKEDVLALVKFWHVLDGIFIWEFTVTLDYEWSVIRGRRPYIWTTWLYSLTRVCTLVSVMLNMLAFDTSSPINCQVWVICLATFSYVAFAAASLLIVIRIIAVWDRNMFAVAIAMCTWSTNVAFFIHSITVLHSSWVPGQNVCNVVNSDSSIMACIATLVSDVVLLLTMLVGLIRLRRHDLMTGFGRLLWKQGLLWLLLVTVAEIPLVVFVILNLNAPFNLMFQTPALIIMAIAATRMYRSLTDYTDSGSFDTYSTPKTDTKQVFSVQIPLEMSVDKFCEDSPRANLDHYASC